MLAWGAGWGGSLQAVETVQEALVMLTPKPGPAPRINGPTVYGCRPGHPFLYRIPTQGERPIRFSAGGLPQELKLDAATGIITGVAPRRGEYEITLRAGNSHGRDRRLFKLVSGDTLALTPPMGWNDWYAHYDRITDQKMRAAADTMIRKGLADVGYQYVNIDDGWMNAEHHADPKRNGPSRDAAGNLLPNSYFPDMKGLADYIHHLGLKAGLYTSPGPRTCAGFAGAYQHEAQDARQFADWGFDFLKYDWCSYDEVIGHPPTLEEMKRPYGLMGGLVKAQKRDLVFNLCQYGMGDVWQWGAEVGGQSWRTAGDLGNELNRVFEVALANCQHRAWQKPGAWNDPDYVQIGYIGSGEGFKPCPLTPSEQYAFMSLWCLMASPLFYSGDLSQVDDFTLNVLCNPEVLEIDQDSLGQCARVVGLTADTFVMVKDLADGSKAIGLGNRGESPTEVTARWPDLGVHGEQRIRDVWRMKDLGRFDHAFASRVPGRALVLVRLSPGK
jgi:alpha-galactosidase